MGVEKGGQRRHRNLEIGVCPMGYVGKVMG